MSNMLPEEKEIRKIYKGKPIFFVRIQIEAMVQHGYMASCLGNASFECHNPSLTQENLTEETKWIIEKCHDAIKEKYKKG